MNDGPLVHLPGDFWSYAEKDAWADFEKEHPVEAKAAKDLVRAVHFSAENTTDRVLTSGVQIEGLWLRVVELLGMVEVERLP